MTLENFIRGLLMLRPVRWVLAVACLVAAADASLRTTTQAAEIAKVELWVVQTTTLTDEQFLTGATQGSSATVAGELRIPQGGTARLPAVVLIHGSSGILASGDVWARHLNDLGIASFALDSFTGRGIINTGADQGQLGNLTMINDAYRALELLSKHPRIDPNRIGILGQSRGGRVALYASMRRFQRLYAPSGLEFAVYLPFSAPCYTTYVGDTDVSDNPIHLFHGTSDDYVTVGPCRSYVERLRGARKNAALTEYPGAHHGFDNPTASGNKVPTLQSARDCLLEERQGGEIVNRATGKRFTWDDSCVARGATVAYHARAHAAALKEVTSILKQVFKLD